MTMLNSWQTMHGARDAQYRLSLLDRRGMFDTFFQHPCPPPPSSARCLDQPDVSLDGGLRVAGLVAAFPQGTRHGCGLRAHREGGPPRKRMRACACSWMCVYVRGSACPLGQIEFRFVPPGESGTAGSVPAGGHGKCAGTAAPRTKAPPGV